MAECVSYWMLAKRQYLLIYISESVHVVSPLLYIVLSQYVAI